MIGTANENDYSPLQSDPKSYNLFNTSSPAKETTKPQ